MRRTSTPSSRPRIDAAPDADPLCPQCGYNLRGLDAGRCPECGLPAGSASVARTAIPWAYRQTLGWLPAYRRTAWLATVNPRKFATEVDNPAGYRDALRFRLLTCLLATVPVSVVGVGIMAWYGSAGFLTLLSPYLINGLMHMTEETLDPTIPWAFTFAIPWESGATLPGVLPAALFLAAVLVSGVASYAFHPRRLPVVRQNRAVALSHYASAPLVLLPVPAAAFMVVAVLQQIALDDPGTSFPRLITLLTVVGSVGAAAVGFLFLRTTLVLLRHAAGARLGKLVAATVLLPTAWVLCGAMALVGVPWVVGLVRLMITSRRG